MHIHLLDQYHTGRSSVHRLDARVKLLLTLAFILVTSLTPAGAWLAYLGLTLLALGVILAAGLPPLLVQRRALVALPFALAALTVLFTTEGRPLFTLSLGAWHLTASQPGLIRFLSILLKSWLSVQGAILLAATTPFPTLVVAMRALRLPRLLVSIIAFMGRYLFVLADEALRLHRAREARSAVIGPGSGGSITWRARVTGGMVGNLFLRSVERSERIYNAMLARGYRGELRTLSPPRLRPADGVLGLLFVALLALIALLGW